jgi:hypothetical protein
MIDRSTAISHCLCALLLAACDVPDGPITRDEVASVDELDGLVLTEAELRDLCAAPPEQARAHPAAVALALCPAADVDGVRVDGPPTLAELANAPHPSEGVCSTGEWKLKIVANGCNSCVFSTPAEPAQRHDFYNQFCYKAPSPPACGCEPAVYVSSTCANHC